MDLPYIPEVLRVSGQFCAELCCGDAAITLALTFESVPCICPWDRAFGSQFDLLDNERVCFALADDGRLMMTHLGIPCQSLTWAKTPPIRSWEAVWGIATANVKDVEKLNLGNLN